MSYSYNKYKNHHKTNMICQNYSKKGIILGIVIKQKIVLV